MSDEVTVQSGYSAIGHYARWETPMFECPRGHRQKQSETRYFGGVRRPTCWTCFGEWAATQFPTAPGTPDVIESGTKPEPNGDPT